MSWFWTALASFLETWANVGAGMASTGYSYEPEVPQELRK